MSVSVIIKGGGLWFVAMAMDVCAVLEVSTSTLSKILDFDEHRSIGCYVNNVQVGNNYNMLLMGCLVVNEAELYHLMMFKKAALAEVANL